MTHHIDITAKHLAIVNDILKSHLPATATVNAFGSRVKGTAKKYSDLDLAIDLGEPISLTLLAKILDAFEESTLPFKIDIIDWQTISDDFKKLIEQDRVMLSI